ncbi:MULTISPECIES: MFS transporter [Olivibacter]|jgi:ACS family hexuronate transporter-like MFS transporter|uniref:MFS transporter n=1 Tax=Olivibacter oleidegradans TaxID=760123 RepID=A0ABV6HLW0_9SPHI|nr:MFS transporter [Olivibacter jilunii]MDX3914509.1 MFS transporter [Pseudosphingobacterium sp.]
MLIPYIRWIIVFLVFIATGLNFLDRQILSITIIKIQKEFNITDIQYGWVNTSFLVSYALMFTIGGRLIERFGGKIGLAVAVGIWSTASALHGFMTHISHLVASRFLLGFGEGACFPGAAKTVNELFNKKERALANGIAIGGSAIGAVLAPVLTIQLSNRYGWRWCFIFAGLVGLVWVAIWLFLRWPKQHKPKTYKEIYPSKPPLPFSQIFRNRSALLMLMIRFLLDPVFYFFMFWIPKYLNETKNVSFDDIGHFLWIPFLALGLSNIAGGYFSDTLIKKGYSVNKARKLVMGVAALLTLSAILIPQTSDLPSAITLMTILLFAHGFWITNYITAISDIFGDRATSTIVGLSGTAGAISGLVINPLIGWIIQQYSYTPLWLICGLMYPIAFLIIATGITIKPYPDKTR